MRVLVIDDHPLILEALSQLLPHQGRVRMLGRDAPAWSHRERARTLAWLGQNEGGAEDLLAQMRAALARFDVQRKAMCDGLATFATAVRLLSGHGITAAQATQWIADAHRIRAVIGCGTR